jgi:hypothetical protein
MNGDVHVRFCEGLGVKFPGATHPARSGRPARMRPLRFVRFLGLQNPLQTVMTHVLLDALLLAYSLVQWESRLAIRCPLA